MLDQFFPTPPRSDEKSKKVAWAVAEDNVGDGRGDDTSLDGASPLGLAGRRTLG